MNTKALSLLMGLAVPTIALAGGGSYNQSLYDAHTGATCNGVFSVDTLKNTRPAGVTSVEMRHISELTRAQQQELAAKKGSASLEAEFHRGSDNCWYMLLKTMSSGGTPTSSTLATSRSTSTTATTTSNNTGSYATYYYGLTSSASRTSSTTVGRELTSTTFRTSSDINFSLYDVMTVNEVPADAKMTIMYNNMTVAQQASLKAFFGARAEGATIYQRANGNWYIMFQ